jgi:FkbM family methyltransferase
MNTSFSSLGDLISKLPGLASFHARTSEPYARIEKERQRLLAASVFGSPTPQPEPLGTFGDVVFPYTRMGAVDSLDLFGLDELIIFSFYATNRHRYHRAVDIGANLGLHSLLMSRCGWEVRAYEPDPHHASLLRRNMELNNADRVELIQSAVSNENGTATFVRVLGNTTSSHLSGAKEGAYGELESFEVRVEGISGIIADADFVKMDAEGQEAIIICATTREDWEHADIMVEVGTAANADAIYRHLARMGVNCFSQKSGWHLVGSAEEMPTHYTDGSLFISTLPAMPWGNP